MTRMLLLLLLSTPLVAEAQTLYRCESDNFVVTARTKNNARLANQTAESWRKHIAMDLFSIEFPPWAYKATILLKQNGGESAGGFTNVAFVDGEINGLDCELEGPIQKILDNAIPHEVCHMVVASYFRKPVPRWLDEGLAVQYESTEAKENWENYMAKALHNKEAVTLKYLVAMKEYPKNYAAFYAQSASTTAYLIRWKGKKPIINALRRLFRGTSWNEAVVQTYGINVDQMQNGWHRDVLTRPAFRLFGRRRGGLMQPGPYRAPTYGPAVCDPNDPNCGLGGPTFTSPLPAMPDPNIPVMGPAPELPMAPVADPPSHSGSVSVSVSGSFITRSVFEKETLKIREEMNGLAAKYSEEYAKKYSEQYTREAVRKYMEENGHLYKGVDGKDGVDGQDGKKGDGLSIADVQVLKQQIVVDMKGDPVFKGPNGRPGRPPSIDVVVDEVLKNLPPTPAYYQILPRTRASAKAMSP